MGYCGRFAPTPSGPLHAGSLRTALASYLQARAMGGTWLLRIDDLDQGRCRPESREQIYRQLEAHGLYWDGSPRLQSQHIDEYEAACAQLRNRGLLYRCDCTRAQLAKTSLAGIDGPVYAGTCRGQPQLLPQQSTRLKVANIELSIDDACQGSLQRSLERDVGDFIVRRADAQIAYQLASVVDEQAQGITGIVRGADLIGSSFRQHYLRQLLGLPQPAYAHLPLAVDSSGRKLSKQNHARSIDETAVSDNLVSALIGLGHPPPPALHGASAAEILSWAIATWDFRKVPSSAPEPLRAGSAAL